ncbi:MAG TPA: hypothetical protein VMW35_12180 [Myxococcota bacterium]|nr:hypothetical protein [Myxococcota bacterium]
MTVDSPDDRCVALPGQFPPGLALLPGVADRAVVVTDTPSTVVPFALDTTPPHVAATGRIPTFPADSDGDGVRDRFGPRPDGVEAIATDLALVTASFEEEVLFVDPASGALRRLEVAVPASLPPERFANLPSPGQSALRTAVSTLACVEPPAGAADSRGLPVATRFPPGSGCLAGVTSYRTRYTSGVALADGHLFVSMSNLGDDAGTANPQFLPGVVLVYDLDLTTAPPRATPHAANGVIFTSAFNPTQVTALHSAGGRDFVLVTDTGALGILQDDPSTPVIDSGGIALSDAAIDVIDAATLQLVATVPLGRALLSFDRLAIDPTKRVAFTGSAAGRNLYAIDLEPLDALPPLAAGDRPYRLDGSDARVGGADARIFDFGHPLPLPARIGGADPQSCPGFTVGTAFDAVGTKLFATDFCDGTLTTVGVDLSGSPPSPVPTSGRFGVLAQSNIVAPVGAGALGRPRGLGSIAVRPGRPGVDYTGPDVFVLVGTPEGLLCALRVDSF